MEGANSRDSGNLTFRIRLLGIPIFAHLLLMEDIRQLIELTRKKGQRSIQLVNQNFRKKEVSKDNLLYEGLLEGAFNTEEEAAKAMFRAKPGNRNFRNTKAKLKAKLLNHLYFLDYNKESYTAYERAEYECMHQLHQCRILMREGLAELAQKLLPALIKKAKEFECIEEVVDALHLLRRTYAEEGKITPFAETADELEYYQQYLTALNETRFQHEEILVYVNKSISAQNRVLSKVPDTLKQLNALAKKFKSDRIKRHAFQLECLYNELTWNFEANTSLCEKIEKQYLSLPTPEVSIDLDKKEVALTRMKAYYALKEGKEGMNYAQKALKQFKSGSGYWYRFMELYFLLMMKTGNYKKAGELFRKVRTNKTYTQLPELERDRWNIYRAFLIFMNNSKLLRWGFSEDEYLQLQPVYPKSLAGYNIALLISQSMMLLRDGRIADFERCLYSLQEYNSTHLDKRHNYRNSIFIRLLDILKEKEYNYELVEEKGRNYRQKLQENQIPGEPVSDMEIIPYEFLYDTLLDYLKTKRAFLHYRFYSRQNKPAEKAGSLL